MSILTMEALNTLFQLTDNRILFWLLHVPSICHMLSLYVDDMVIFIVPDEQDLRLVRVILVVFMGASGLHTISANASLPRSNAQLIRLS
jgi:hypothetical protein